MTTSRDPAHPQESTIAKGRGRASGRRRVSIAALLAGLAVVLVACGGASASFASKSAFKPPPSGGTPLPGGVASYSLPIGEDFSWMFPIENQANYEDWDSNVEDGMWRPLYFAGSGGQTGINYPLSLATAPVYSNGDKTVTVTLNQGYTWTDGTPVTTTDIRFFFELLTAGKNQDGAYIPGEMPDDISSVIYNSPYQFTLDLTQAYNPDWFTNNQLPWIYPLPQQAWDKTCANCAVGQAASTAAGAKAVFKFLYGQSEKLSTYGSNPLWKVVDGPWVIKSFDPTTYTAAFSANGHYTGPSKPKLSGYQIYSFASNTAEVDALRSGDITFGFLPFSDVSLASYFEQHGYSVAAWPVFYNETVELGYSSRTWGPLVKQLYIRQALQHVINQPLYINHTMHGLGIPDYGPAADYPGSIYVSPQLRTNPYPYDPEAAKHLLASHGWVRGSGGIDTCQRPGTASNECGTGIHKGKQLSFLFMYSTGTPSFLAQVEAFSTAAKSAGIGINLDGQTETTMFSIGGVCPASSPCNWGLLAYSGFMWDYGQYEILPVGGNQFGKGNFWAGGYNSVEADELIAAAHTESGLSHLYQVEDYLSKNEASLWWPLEDYEIVVARNTLRGWYPLNPYGNYHPSSWSFVK
ncbi:MAG: ABC transporter substrate-binding protein [Candidatus Dormibacteria bacterium]